MTEQPLPEPEDEDFASIMEYTKAMLQTGFSNLGFRDFNSLIRRNPPNIDDGYFEIAEESFDTERRITTQLIIETSDYGYYIEDEDENVDEIFDYDEEPEGLDDTYCLTLTFSKLNPYSEHGLSITIDGLSSIPDSVEEILDQILMEDIDIMFHYIHSESRLIYDAKKPPNMI